MARRRRLIGANWPLLLVLGAVLAVYTQTVTFSFVNWDDPGHVYRNRSVVEPRSVSWGERWFPRHLGYPMPATLLTYRLDRALHGPASLQSVELRQGRGYHATNLVLTLALVVVLYSICRRLVCGPWAAAGGAALFALHPAAVETIAWVTGRKELLAALGLLAALAAWLAFLRRRGSARWLAFLLLALAALAAKPTAVVLLPLATWLWLDRQRGSLDADARRRRIANGLAALLLVAAATVAVVLVSLAWQRALGATESQQPLARGVRRALFALGYHVRLVLFPLDLRAKYLVEPGGPGGYDLLGLLALVGLVAPLLRARWRRGAAGLGAALFLVGYLPSSSLVPLRRYLSDTYVFVPLLGLGLLGAAALAALPRKCGGRALVVARVGVVALLATLAGLSARQARTWRDSDSLWLEVARHHPDNAIVCRMLGEGQIEAGQPARAVATYEECGRRFGLGPYLNNLGIAHYLLRDYPAARRCFRSILARRPTDVRALWYLRRMDGAH